MKAKVDIRIQRVRAQLIRDYPFFGSLAMRLIPVEWTGNQTMATDSKHLFYSTVFLDKQPESVVLMGVAHEAMHCALGHHTRRGSRDPKLWQIACDHVDNLMLKKAGFDVPKWTYCDPVYDGLNAEQVCRLLEQQQEQEAGPGELDDQQQDGGQPGGDKFRWDKGDVEFEDDTSPCSNLANSPTQGDGEPASSGDPGGMGEVLDAAPSHDQAALDEAADEWAVYTRQAVATARRAGEGKLPGFIEELVEHLNDPKVDWRSALRRFVDPSTTKDYSWASPNKRLMSMGIYTPGLVTDGVNHVAFLIDTSASIDYEWLKQSGGEVQAALDDGAIDKVTLVFCDEQVHTTRQYVKGELVDFTVLGRGGTRFAPAFDWVNRNEPDVSVAVYLTDLECSDYGPQPSYPVLWMVHGDPRYVGRHMSNVPFGECVVL